ncbi:MAG: hypothetical protein F4Y44_06580 [Chloroflexi bacterium]|nr:hypothetical protein [Chloroflexota bacterium]
MQTEDSGDASIQGQEGDEDTERVPALSLDSPWAWFYYSTFGVQLVGVSIYAVLRHVAALPSATPFDIYVAILPEVSDGLPAMAAYSLLIAVTVEVIRMIAERYLAKRFKQGKQEGISQGKQEGISEVLEMLDEKTRKEVERKLQRNGDLHGST